MFTGCNNKNFGTTFLCLFIFLLFPFYYVAQKYWSITDWKAEEEKKKRRENETHLVFACESWRGITLVSVHTPDSALARNSFISDIILTFAFFFV